MPIDRHTGSSVSSSDAGVRLVPGVAVIGQKFPSAQNLGRTPVRPVAESPATPSFVPGEVLAKLRSVAGVGSVMTPSDLQQLRLQTSPKSHSGDELTYQILPSTRSSLLRAEETQDRIRGIAQNLRGHPNVGRVHPPPDTATTGYKPQ